MMQTAGFVMLGLVAGFAGGCFGVGGGAIMVPVMILYFHVPYHVAVATSLALIIPISLAGSAANWRFGTIDWKIFAACAVAGMVGAAVGAHLIQRVPVEMARKGFAIFLLYSAWRLWK